jgi:hypothetical protein
MPSVEYIIKSSDEEVVIALINATTHGYMFRRMKDGYSKIHTTCPLEVFMDYVVIGYGEN